MKKQSWVIIPIDSHISFEIPSGSLNAVQGYCGNLEGNVESTLHEFEEAKLQLEIPVKYVSISDRSLSSLLSRIKKDAHSTCSVLYVEGVIKETNFDEVYIFSGTLSSAGYKNHFSMFVTGGNETNISGNLAESCFDFTGQLDVAGLWPKDVASLIHWKDLSTTIILRGRIKIKRVVDTENKKTICHKLNSV